MANTITSFICSLQTIVSKRERDLLIDKELNSVKPLWNPPVRISDCGLGFWGFGCLGLGFRMQGSGFKRSSRVSSHVLGQTVEGLGPV